MRWLLQVCDLLKSNKGRIINNVIINSNTTKKIRKMSSSVSGSRTSSNSQQNSFPYYQDAVRIFVQHVGGEESATRTSDSDPMTTSTSSIKSSSGGGGYNNSRRFSVDPQLTNFDILRNLVGRAFDMKGDFSISYRAFDDLGGETYLPMVSDWDLSAAFLSASDPDLQLVIEPKNIPVNDAELDGEAWDIVQSTEVIRDASQTMVPPLSSNEAPLGYRAMSSSNSDNHSHHFPNNHQNFYHDTPMGSGTNSSALSSSGSTSSSKVLCAMSQLGGAVNQYPISLNSKINTAGIFNTMEKWVQKAKTFVEDLSVVTTRPPLSDIEFRNYLDPGGVLCRPRELRYACYHGGIEPGLKKVVWKHLLNIYPDGLSGNARMEYVRSKSKDYYELRDTWKSVIQDGRVSEDIQCISNMVRKDVLRTDRHLQFFAGDDNQNIGLLFNILTTFALNHPSVGYCQGMSDLASPLLVTMGDEAQAYVCFCALMERTKPNFNCDGLAMSLKFTHLSETLAYYDPDFWAYLKTIGADDLLFCYRWLLLELKREFAFDDALRMMEVLWASLPYKPQDVPLFEVKFTLSSANSIPIANSLTSSYSRVCALRRSSSSIGGHPPTITSNTITTSELRSRRYSRKPKSNPLSLDENSLTSMSSLTSSLGISGTGSSSVTGSGSTSVIRSHAKPFYSLDETIETLSSSDFISSHFETLSPKPKKLIKNLKEFWTISGGGIGTGVSKPPVLTGDQDHDESQDSTPFSSKSSTLSNFEGMNTDGDCNGGVFFDDPHSDLNGINNTGSICGDDSPPTMSTNSLESQRHQVDYNNVPRSRNGSSNATQKLVESLLTINSTNSSATMTRLSSGSLTATTTNPTMNLNKSEKSDSFLQHEEGDNNSAFPPTCPPQTPGDQNQDPEGTSQTSNADSEHDSGHCYGDSMELFESCSLNEPQFSRGRVSKAKMPSPDTLGGGNPFLMFLCVTLLLQHRDHIMRNGMDYNETAMYYDKLIRKHNVLRVLAHARMLYSEYLKQNVPRV